MGGKKSIARPALAFNEIWPNLMPLLARSLAHRKKKYENKDNTAQEISIFALPLACSLAQGREYNTQM